MAVGKGRKFTTFSLGTLWQDGLPQYNQRTEKLSTAEAETMMSMVLWDEGVSASVFANAWTATGPP
jgi:hypothetical protein